MSIGIPQQLRAIVIFQYFFMLLVQLRRPPKLPHKIGWLGARAGITPSSGHELFRRELQKIGYFEETNFIIESRYAESPAPAARY